jgi:site-specific DNA-methyltransferase (adenine-specific)
MIDLNTIICGDCLDVLRIMPDEYIDLIFTSPIYNLGNNHHTRSKRINPYDDNMPELEYQQWQLAILNECFRVLKNGGSMWYNHKNRIKNGVQITPYEWLLQSNFIIKQEIIWFNQGPNFDKVRFYPMTERLYWLVKSPKTKMINVINHHDLFTTQDWKPEGTNKEHKRAFPVKMVTDILYCFPEAEIILDPFMGSGTVAVASKMLGRSYIGIEISPEYCNYAENRLKHTLKQLF